MLMMSVVVMWDSLSGHCIRLPSCERHNGNKWDGIYCKARFTLALSNIANKEVWGGRGGGGEE